MTHSIMTKEIKPQPVLVVRKKTTRDGIAGAIQSSLQAVGMYAQGKAVAFAGAPFARYIEMTPGSITMEVGMPISGPHQTEANDGAVVYSELAGGLVATTIHQGPYDQLSNTWQEMNTWLETGGHKASSNEFPWESYITDPGQVPNPADWKTELFWPLSS